MTLVIPPGYGQVSIEMRHVADPDPWFVTFGVGLNEIGGDYDAAMANIRVAWGQSFGKELSSQVTTTAVNLAVGQDGPDRLIFRQNTNIVGESDQQKLPQNCALLLTKNTALAGRKGRGRMFIPAIISDSICSSAGILDPGYAATYTTIGTQLLEGLADPQEPGSNPPTPMFLLHNSGATTPPPTAVVSMVASDLISTQRRRLR